jgi:predicted RNA-binding protein with PUA-like domain
MRTALGHSSFNAHRSVKVTGLHPQRQCVGIDPGLLLEERGDAERVGQMQLRQRLLRAVDCDSFQDAGLGFAEPVHLARNVGSMAESVGQVHRIVEASVELGGRAVVATGGFVVAKVASNPASLHMNGGAQRLAVFGAAGFESVAEELTRMLATLLTQSGAATLEQRCGRLVLHCASLTRLPLREKQESFHAPVGSGTIVAMAYFLFKTEPEVYSFDDFLRDKETIWDNVTNPTAVKYLREMKAGTKWIFYHTGDERTAVGTGTVVSVDPSDPKVPIVKVKVGKRLKHPKTLAAIKAESLFAGSPLVIIGRLSVVPLTQEQWNWLLG